MCYIRSLTKVASVDLKGSYSTSQEGALSNAPIGSPRPTPAGSPRPTIYKCFPTFPKRMFAL